MADGNKEDKSFDFAAGYEKATAQVAELTAKMAALTAANAELTEKFAAAELTVKNYARAEKLGKINDIMKKSGRPELKADDPNAAKLLDLDETAFTAMMDVMAATSKPGQKPGNGMFDHQVGTGNEKDQFSAGDGSGGGSGDGGSGEESPLVKAAKARAEAAKK